MLWRGTGNCGACQAIGHGETASGAEARIMQNVSGPDDAFALGATASGRRITEQQGHGVRVGSAGEQQSGCGSGVGPAQQDASTAVAQPHPSEGEVPHAHPCVGWKLGNPTATTRHHASAGRIFLTAIPIKSIVRFSHRQVSTDRGRAKRAVAAPRITSYDGLLHPLVAGTRSSRHT